MQAARRLLSLLCVVAFAGLVLTACGGDEEPAATSGEEASGTTEVDIANFKYEPDTISVSAGDTVTWTNQDGVPHTVTAGDRDVLQAGAMAAGESLRPRDVGGGAFEEIGEI